MLRPRGERFAGGRFFVDHSFGERKYGNVAPCHHLALQPLVHRLALADALADRADLPVHLELPQLAGENKELGKLIREWHGDIGRAGYALIGLHAAAALTHHVVWRDNTLRRMLPSRLGRT
ncbi:MAG: cytochrome b/b6 domain-containing protein [Methylibium sp.]|nr:cytochrome b/b6 domain-containing protein [Methylibium sp.]